MRIIMDTNAEVFELAQAATAERTRVGGKAGVLGELAAAGFPVPPGLVVTAEALNIDGWEESLEAAAGSLGAPRLAVRSSAAAEDLPDASYAGLYETYLNVPVGGLGEMVRRCFAAATAEPVSTYHRRHGNGTAPGMAVLVLAMVDPMSAGVAFTAHPVSGDRDQTLVTAVPGLGDRLVSGEVVGDEWTLTARNARRSRPIPAGGRVLTARQAQAVADLARKVADRYGRPLTSSGRSTGRAGCGSYRRGR
jgi:phosphoenolpyruvate synthase/pyruvate phosphate dikinase